MQYTFVDTYCKQHVCTPTHVDPHLLEHHVVNEDEEEWILMNKGVIKVTQKSFQQVVNTRMINIASTGSLLILAKGSHYHCESSTILCHLPHNVSIKHQLLHFTSNIKCWTTV